MHREVATNWTESLRRRTWRENVERMKISQRSEQSEQIWCTMSRSQRGRFTCQNILNIVRVPETPGNSWPTSLQRGSNIPSFCAGSPPGNASRTPPKRHCSRHNATKLLVPGARRMKPGDSTPLPHFHTCSRDATIKAARPSITCSEKSAPIIRPGALFVCLQGSGQFRLPPRP